MTDGTTGKNLTDITEERDPVLNSMLQKWHTPEISRELDRRILEDYRSTVQIKPVWQRFFTASVRVPLPVAIAALMLLFVAGAVAIRRQPVLTTTPPTPISSGTMRAIHTDPPVVIRTNLEGFQPVTDVNITVMEEFKK
jgi:hypothetical protein